MGRELCLKYTRNKCVVFFNSGAVVLISFEIIVFDVSKLEVSDHYKEDHVSYMYIKSKK